MGISNRKMFPKSSDRIFARVCGWGVLLILWVLAPLTGPRAEALKKVAIFPLTVNAPERMDYVREGVQAVLAARLAWEDRVVVIDPAQVQRIREQDPRPLDGDRVTALGKQLGADVALWGAINVQGTTVGIDIDVLPFAQRQPVKKFYAQAKTIDEVIVRVQELADMISEKVFDRPRAVLTPIPTAPSAAAEGGGGKTPVSLKDLTIDPKSPSRLISAGGFELAGVWRSASLPLVVVDLAVADVDQDGRQETVLISKNKVYIYRFEKDRFELVQEIPGRMADNFLSLDIADIQGSGIPQLFITNYRDNTLRSFVLRWSEGGFKVVAQNLPYYFRVHRMPGRGTVLLGQKKYGEEFFDTTLFVLSWKGGRLVPSEKLALPEGLTVYDFVLLESNPDGSLEILHINRFNQLMVVTEKGKAKYVSKENFGGTLNRIRSDQDNLFAVTKDEEKLSYYIPARLLLADGSNPKEVILNKNKGSFFNFLARYKAFSSGEIHALSWDGGTVKEKWRTPVISDYIANYNVGEFKNNGQKQLVVGVVQSTGSIPLLTEARSMLYVYDLGTISTTP